MQEGCLGSSYASGKMENQETEDTKRQTQHAHVFRVFTCFPDAFLEAKLLPAARRPCRTANEVIISGTVLPFASAVVHGEACGTRGAKFF